MDNGNEPRNLPEDEEQLENLLITDGDGGTWFIPAQGGGGMSYATPADVEARLGRVFTPSETARCTVLLQDAGAMIDALAPNAAAGAKAVVSCRVVERVMADTGAQGAAVPMGATQGSMSALGYSQSWTVGSGGSAGELYLSRMDRRLLGMGNKIGSYSPTQELAAKAPPEVWQ